MADSGTIVAGVICIIFGIICLIRVFVANKNGAVSDEVAIALAFLSLVLIGIGIYLIDTGVKREKYSGWFGDSPADPNAAGSGTPAATNGAGTETDTDGTDTDGTDTEEKKDDKDDEKKGEKKDEKKDDKSVATAPAQDVAKPVVVTPPATNLLPCKVSGIDFPTWTGVQGKPLECTMLKTSMPADQLKCCNERDTPGVCVADFSPDAYKDPTVTRAWGAGCGFTMIG